MKLDFTQQSMNEEPRLKYFINVEKLVDLKRTLRYKYEARLGGMGTLRKVAASLEKDGTELHITWDGVIADLKSGSYEPCLDAEKK